MIYITGDTHGLIDFDKLNYFKTIYTSEKDVLIILGDAGIAWSEEELEHTISKYELLGITIIFIDGNHENFSMLNNLPIVEMYGAKMHKISNNIYHVLRGEITTINNLNFLCLGGAISIDKHYRILNKSYWLEEEITEKDINNALTNLKKYNFEVDYVLTHCVDTITLINEFGYNPDSCTDRLNFIDKFVKYKYWYFGHYHIDEDFNKKRCFYDDILTINEVYKGNENKNIIRNVYFEQKIKQLRYFSNKPYLYSNFIYKTKITKEDLPEWFVYGRYHKRFGYLSSKNIIKIKYKPNMWINHYLRDDNLILKYDDSLEIWVDGFDIINMINAIEKYNNIDLTYLKHKINYKAEFYNRYHKEDCWFEPVENAFKHIKDEELFELIDTLIDILVDSQKISLPIAAEIVMHSDLSDLIFDKNTNYYDKAVDELICILKDETGLKRKYS